MNFRTVTTCAIALLAVTAIASAEISTYAVVARTTAQGVVNEVFVDATTDWTNSVSNLDLTSGSIYQDAVGGDQEPNPAFIAVFPTLADDTYAAVPAGYPALASFAGTPAINATDFDASWFNTAAGDVGTGLKIAQITLSNDANGTYTVKSYDIETAGVGVEVTYPIVNGVITPEPATLSILGLGAVALIRRR